MSLEKWMGTRRSATEKFDKSIVPSGKIFPKGNTITDGPCYRGKRGAKKPVDTGYDISY